MRAHFRSHNKDGANHSIRHSQKPDNSMLHAGFMIYLYVL